MNKEAQRGNNDFREICKLLRDRNFLKQEAIMDKLEKLIDVLNKLEEANIYFQLGRVRNGSVLVEAAVPGQLWEIEFSRDGSIDVEVYKSDGNLFDEKQLEVLFKD